MKETIIHETNGTVAKVIFNDPPTYNSFNLDTITQFANTIISLACDESIRGIIISGTGRSFCTGGDLKWASAHPHGPATAFHELSSRFHQSITEIRNMKKPVIAAINGIAAGGGFSLALACDFRIMAKSALFKQGFTSNGLSIDGGGTASLQRLVGMARAMEIIAFDEPLSPEKSLEYGLIHQIVSDKELIPESEKLITRICNISLHSFGWSKQLLNNSFSSTFETQLEAERLGLSTCAAHRDGVEGIRAFLEKRRPKFNQ
ncbi:MAG: enoyl-CoA hydratase/isomerase family protein [Spirochaetes bacterium]|nr:enoyl-CoA hydratase/isomerase family protein [Spirochaetota bacterium]